MITLWSIILKPVQLLVLLAHIRLLQCHRDLVEDRGANQQTDGNSPTKSVIMILQLVVKLNHLNKYANELGKMFLHR